MPAIYFTLDWLLRCINSLVTGEALLHGSCTRSVNDFQDGLKKSEKYIELSS